MKKMLLAALAAASATALIAPAVATAAPETADATATATAVPAVLDATALPGARTTDPTGTRTQWPETLGLPKAWAEKVILRDRPDLRVVHVPEGALVTMEYDENRVRIVHDAFGLVTQVPTIG